MKNLERKYGQPYNIRQKKGYTRSLVKHPDDERYVDDVILEEALFDKSDKQERVHTVTKPPSGAER